MNYYKFVITYIGTNYSGWQTQSENSNTIQETIETTLKPIIDYQDFNFYGASRTDKGVHADYQIAKLSAPTDITSEKLKMGLNSKLPSDIRIISCEKTTEQFNPTQNIKSKIYHYYFSLTPLRSSLISNFIIDKSQCDIDMKRLEQACLLFEGKHFFQNFTRSGSRHVNFQREVTQCRLYKTNLHPLAEEVYFIKFQSTGFLKYMIRFMMNAIFQFAANNLNESEFKNILQKETQYQNLKKEPAHALKLHYIEYIS